MLDQGPQRSQIWNLELIWTSYIIYTYQNISTKYFPEHYT